MDQIHFKKFPQPHDKSENTSLRENKTYDIFGQQNMPQYLQEKMTKSTN